MAFAVVKFIHEDTDSDTEIVSEIPVSWMTKDNKFCKWPPKQFSSVYISKSFPPEDNWKEYPIIVEHICDTLIEAKAKVKEVGKENLGRGLRKIKNTSYYSPAEEEQRQKYKESFKGKGCVKDFHQSFINIMNGSATAAMQEVSTCSMNLLNNSHKHTTAHEDDETLNEDPLSSFQLESFQDNDSVIQTNFTNEDPAPASPSPTISSGTIVCDKDIESISKKIDSIFNFLSALKIDIQEIKESLQMTTNKGDEGGKLPVNLPMKSLTDIEELEKFINSNEENKQTYIRYIKSIGGNNCKDFTLRICRSLFSNILGEMCSWLGRKNNYAVGNLQITNLAFAVVHHKTSGTRKVFEDVFAEWLRHSKQRRFRENNKNVL